MLFRSQRLRIRGSNPNTEGVPRATSGLEMDHPGSDGGTASGYPTRSTPCPDNLLVPGVHPCRGHSSFLPPLPRPGQAPPLPRPEGAPRAAQPSSFLFPPHPPVLPSPLSPSYSKAPSTPPPAPGGLLLLQLRTKCVLPSPPTPSPCTAAFLTPCLQATPPILSCSPTSSEPRAWTRNPNPARPPPCTPPTPLPGGDRRGCRLPQPSVEVPGLGPRRGTR